MDAGESPVEWPRPWKTRHEPEHADRYGAPDHQVHHHRFEFAWRPVGPVPARGLDEEEQNVHTIMIRCADGPAPPFDLPDMPFGE